MRIIMKANELFNAAMQLDLTSIKIKLMHQQSGEGWSLDKANAVEKEYRRFLCLMKLFPHESMAPLVDVDTFWHYHILDTVKYAADCEQVFGYFLHHDPYVGLDGTDEDEQFRLDSGERMCELYENLFGDAYPMSFDADVQATAYCAGPVPPGKQTRRKGAHQVPPPQVGLGSATAYCAGPVPPGISARSGSVRMMAVSREIRAATTAYCAGPVPPGKRAGSSKAGALVPSRTTLAAATAYCAGPVPPGKPIGTASASGSMMRATA
jgi:hypothetical protein